MADCSENCPHKRIIIKNSECVTSLITTTEVLKSRLDGVENVIQDIKDDLKDIKNTNLETNKSINKLVVGGLSSVILIILSIVLQKLI